MRLVLAALLMTASPLFEAANWARMKRRSQFASLELVLGRMNVGRNYNTRWVYYCDLASPLLSTLLDRGLLIQ